ncbi:Ig kappa chain V-V region MOPC 149 [Takifugu rubripes]|uniref:Ig kappa chain V-V region MOPC 149 n=1 Tax=Takifugu rubripes TaxID=31033 RepID=UPI003D30767F
MGTIFAALSLFLLVDAPQAVLITQWPQHISSLPDGSTEMHCFQNDTDYDYVYWYRQKDGESFQMVASLVADLVNFEEGFKSGFEAATVTKKLWSLKISSVQRADQAVYLCAASLHNAAAQRTSVTKTRRAGSWLASELR